MGNFLGGREDPPCDTEDSSDEDLPFSVFGRQRNDNPEVIPPQPPVVLTIDASRNTGQGLNNSICTFEADKEPPSRRILKKIENELEEYEKISLIYLLFDGRYALWQMEKLLLEAESNFLYDWFLEHKKEKTAKAMFVEAMCVIQNFEVLKKVLDYPSKRDLEARFSPNRKEVATNLNLIKKYIYKLFDNMQNDHYNKFMDLVFHDFRAKGHLFRNFRYFEMFFAYFESIDYIATFKLSNLIRHIKAMEMYSDDFDSAHRFFESKKQYEAPGGIDSYSEGMSNLNISYNDDEEEPPSNAADRINPWNIPTTSRQSTSAMPLGEHHMKYHINPDSPGTFLLIENKYFFPEPDPQYEKLVIQEQTETRVGTEKDSTRIIKIFQEMGYNCIHEQNVEHYKTIDLIKNVVSDVTEEESTFYICILSHGQRGNVIASNKIAVSVESIKKAMVSPKLEGKPKVLILQACQGDVMQTVSSLPNGLTLDGPGTLQLPTTVDVLEIRSTVEGFVSIRDIYEGTWFIQSLCEMLEQYPTEHLVGICQRTNHLVSTKGYPVDAQRIIIKMVCEFRSTLTKDLYLCP